MEIGTPLSAFEALEAAVADVQKAFAAGLWQCPEGEVLDLTRRHQGVLARVQSVGLTLIREVETRGVPAAGGATSTQAFLSGALRMSPGMASEQAQMASSLAEKCRETGAALAAGAISYEQAKAVRAAVEGLPERASFEQRAGAEEFLLGHCGSLNALDIAKLHKKLDEVIDPDGTLPREECAQKKRGATIRENHGGTQTIHWRDTDENIALVKAAMMSLGGPVPGPDGERDERTPTARRADALLDLCARALRSGELPESRGERPHLHVTFSAETLREEPGHGFGRTSTEEHLSAAATRRLACDAHVRGILLDGAGVPLKVGRAHRTIQPGQWVALVARDVGCQFPTCTRPAAWSDAHHIVHWADGGPLDLDNFALLCGPHHDVVHHGGWDIELGPDRRPHMRPPAWVDVERRPRVNLHWRRQQDLTANQLELGTERDPEPDPPPDPAPDP